MKNLHKMQNNQNISNAREFDVKIS